MWMFRILFIAANLAVMCAWVQPLLATEPSPETSVRCLSDVTLGRSERAVERQVLTPAQAVSCFGQAEVTVRMLVRKAKDRLDKRGIIFLDSELDFTDQQNLGIAISAHVAEEFKQWGIDDLPSYLADRTIEVTGCVMKFEQRVYMPVLSSQQLRIGPPKAPADSAGKVGS